MNVVLEALVLIIRITYYCLENIFLALVPRNSKSISRQVALVTGGGRGIGQAISLELARHGAIVAVLDLDKTSGDETVELVRAIGGTAVSFACDVTDTKQVADVAAKVRSELGSVDILVNNAGVANGAIVTQKKESDIRRTLEVNALSHFWTIRQFLPSMIERKSGHIVLISSILGMYTCQLVSDYCAAKFAVHGLSEALLDDLRYMNVRGVHVTTVYPAAVGTAMLTSGEPKIVYRTRFDSVQTPDEVAKAIVNGLRQNKRYVFVPSYLQFLRLSNVMPYKAIVALKEFVGSGFFETDR